VWFTAIIDTALFKKPLEKAVLGFFEVRICKIFDRRNRDDYLPPAFTAAIHRNPAVS
jgi:hypothetical protein